MQGDQTNVLNDFLQWLANEWAKIGILALAYKGIDGLFRYLNKRTDARIREIIAEQHKATVEPQIEKLNHNMEALKESIWRLTDKIK